MRGFSAAGECDCGSSTFRWGRALIDGWLVAVPVDDLPFAVFPPVDVGDAERVRRDRAAFGGRRGALVADRIGQVATHARGHEVEAICGAVGEARGDPEESPAHLVPPAVVWPECSEQGHRVAP